MRDLTIVSLVGQTLIESRGAGDLDLLIEIIKHVEDGVLIIDLDNLTVRKNAAHTGHKIIPFHLSVKVIDHEKAAAQKVVAQFLALRVGEIPAPDFDRIEPWPVVDIVTLVEINYLLGRTGVNATEPAHALHKLPVGFGEVGAPTGSAAPSTTPVSAGVSQPAEGPFGLLIGVGRDGRRISLFVGKFAETMLSEQREERNHQQTYSRDVLPLHCLSRISRDTLELVLSSFRLLPLAVWSASLFAVDRLQPVEVARFPVFTSSIVFDQQGYGYVSHGRFISRLSTDGKSAIWAETGAPRGHKILPDGTHLVCDPSHRAVLRLDRQGKTIGTASSESEGKPLHEPEDLTLDPKGGFYFTDPGGSRDGTGAIHFVDPRGKTHLAASGLHYPNGIALRPDGKTLLVAEGMRNRILTYDVVAPGRLGPMKVLATLPVKQSGQIDNQPDGLCFDQRGNLYVAHNGMKVVEVISRKGRWIRQYPAGLLSASSVAFGGPKTNQLYITGGLGEEGKSQGGVFRLDLRSVRGIPPGGAQK